MTIFTQSLAYHEFPIPGKWRIAPCKALDSQHDLSLAYSPGVASPCQAIQENPHLSYTLTNKGRLVAVISNGTAVLGLGNIGALASKPVMEGKAVLFKKFGRVDAIDLEIEEEDPYKLVEIIKSLAPTFGGINLEDIKAPDCFIIEKLLIESLDIPVFHDDQHGTAIVIAAGLINALFLQNKEIEDVRCVVCGAGAGALACLDLLTKIGLRRENITLVDSKGVVHKDRDDLNEYKVIYAQSTTMRSLADALQGADVFLGLSKGDQVTSQMVQTMAEKPIVFALANPNPEIFPERVYEVHPQALVATGRSDYPNQINNVLCFPYIFRGVLEAQATCINMAMKKACVHSLVQIAREGHLDVLYNHDIPPFVPFGRDYFIPRPFDHRLLERIPLVTAQAAIDSGVAKRTRTFVTTLKRQLISENYENKPVFQKTYEANWLRENDQAEARPLIIQDIDHCPALWPNLKKAMKILMSYNAVRPFVQSNHMETLQYFSSQEGFAHLVPTFEAGEVLRGAPIFKPSFQTKASCTLKVYRLKEQFLFSLKNTSRHDISKNILGWMQKIGFLGRMIEDTQGVWPWLAQETPLFLEQPHHENSFYFLDLLSSFSFSLSENTFFFAETSNSCSMIDQAAFAIGFRQYHEE